MSDTDSSNHTPDNSSDSEEDFYTPIHPIMADTNISNTDDENEVNNPVSTTNGPMTLEGLAQLINSRFAAVEAIIDKTDKKTEDTKLSLEAFQEEIFKKSLINEGLRDFNINDEAAVNSIKYQEVKDDVLLEKLDYPFKAKIVSITERGEILIIKAAFGIPNRESDMEKIDLVITKKTLATNVGTTTLMEGDVINIKSYMAEKSDDPVALSLDPDFDYSSILKVYPGGTSDYFKVIRILSFTRLFRSSEAQIKVIANDMLAVKRDHIALGSSFKQLQTEVLLKEIPTQDPANRRDSMETRKSLLKENEYNNPTKRRNSNFAFIGNEMKEGQIVADGTDAKDDDEKDVYVILKEERDKKNTVKGHTKKLDLVSVKIITEAISDVHDSHSNTTLNNGKTPPHIHQLVVSRATNNGFKYEDGHKTPTQADINFFYSRWIFGESNPTSNVNKIGSNKIVISQPPTQEIIENLRKQFNGDFANLAKASGKDYNRIAALRKMLNLYDKFDIQVSHVLSELMLKNLVAKNEQRTDNKGRSIMQKMNVDSINNILSVQSYMEDENKAIDELSFDDIIDMWLYAIHPKSKEDFLSAMYEALHYNRSVEPLLPNIHLDSVLYFRHIYTRALNHIHDFKTLFQLMMTYLDQAHLPPNVQAPVTSVSSFVPNDQTRPKLLDLLSAFIKSSPIDAYFVQLWNTMDDTFKQDVRTNKKPFLEFLQEFGKMVQQDLDTSESTLKLHDKIKGTEKSAETFYANRLAKYASTSTKSPSYTSLPRPTHTTSIPFTQAKPSTTGPINKYFSKVPSNASTQSLRSYQPEYMYHPQHGVVYRDDNYNEYNDDYERREIARGYVDTIDEVNRYDVNDSLYHMAYPNQNPFDNADPNILVQAINMVTSSRYPALDKHQSQQNPKGPCFNFFESPKGCPKSNCQYSHDRGEYNKFLEKKLEQSKALLQRNQSASHISTVVPTTVDIETGGGEGGGEQGGTSSTELDTGQHSAQVNTFAPSMLDDREKVNFFHASYANMDNEEQLHVLQHVKDMQQHKASNMMYQQGFVNGRLV